MSAPHRGLLAAGLVVALATVGGCSDDASSQNGRTPASSATASTSPSGSPTPESSTTLAPIPPEADGDSYQAASAYGRWWYGELIPYTFASGDVAPLRATYIDQCLYCVNLSASIADAYARGESFQGSAATVTSSESSGIDPDGIAEVTVFADVAAVTQVDRSGRLVKEFGASAAKRSNLYIFRKEGSWVVFDSTFGDPYASPSPSAP